MRNVLAVILGGGQGTRLYPLTKYRAKPAVPIGGKFRLIDIPISLCIHSEVKKIYVLTQFNTASLHRHIFNTYKFDRFSRGFVTILSAQQTMERSDWYQGTADAVRQNLDYIEEQDVDYVLILSGDQLFRLDIKDLVNFHKEKQAEITISSTPIEREKASSFGILRVNRNRRIVDFVEKPKDPALLDSLAIPPSQLEKTNKDILASMGIYLFNKDVLIKILKKNLAEDFGKQIIPVAIEKNKVYSYVFNGYWEDIGTIKSFFEANLDFANPVPQFNFYDEYKPVYTNARSLPGSKIKNCVINHALISDGSILEGSMISNSVIGLRSIIEQGSTLENVVMMGADYYKDIKKMGNSKMGVGKNCFIRNAILDKDVGIGDNVIIDYQGTERMVETDLYHIVDGIVVIPKKVYIPANTRVI